MRSKFDPTRAKIPFSTSEVGELDYLTKELDGEFRVIDLAEFCPTTTTEGELTGIRFPITPENEPESIAIFRECLRYATDPSSPLSCNVAHQMFPSSHVAALESLLRIDEKNNLTLCEGTSNLFIETLGKVYRVPQVVLANLEHEAIIDVPNVVLEAQKILRESNGTKDLIVKKYKRYIRDRLPHPVTAVMLGIECGFLVENLVGVAADKNGGIAGLIGEITEYKPTLDNAFGGRMTYDRAANARSILRNFGINMTWPKEGGGARLSRDPNEYFAALAKVISSEKVASNIALLPELGTTRVKTTVVPIAVFESSASLILNRYLEQDIEITNALAVAIINMPMNATTKLLTAYPNYGNRFTKV